MINEDFCCPFTFSVKPQQPLFPAALKIYKKPYFFPISSASMHARFLGNRKLGKFQRNWFSSDHIQNLVYSWQMESSFSRRNKNMRNVNDLIHPLHTNVSFLYRQRTHFLTFPLQYHFKSYYCIKEVMFSVCCSEAKQH